MNGNPFDILDNWTIDYIFKIAQQTSANDAQALIMCTRLRSTCRRFAAIISPNVTRINVAYLISTLARTECVTELRQVLADARDLPRTIANIRAHWPLIAQACCESLSSDCAQILYELLYGNVSFADEPQRILDFINPMQFHLHTITFIKRFIHLNIKKIMLLWGYSSSLRFFANYLHRKDIAKISLIRAEVLEPGTAQSIMDDHYPRISVRSQHLCKICKNSIIYNLMDVSRGPFMSCDRNKYMDIVRVRSHILHDDHFATFAQKPALKCMKSLLWRYSRAELAQTLSESEISPDPIFHNTKYQCFLNGHNASWFVNFALSSRCKLLTDILPPIYAPNWAQEYPILNIKTSHKFNATQTYLILAGSIMNQSPTQFRETLIQWLPYLEITQRVMHEILYALFAYKFHSAYLIQCAKPFQMMYVLIFELSRQKILYPYEISIDFSRCARTFGANIIEGDLVRQLASLGINIR